MITCFAWEQFSQDKTFCYIDIHLNFNFFSFCNPNFYDFGLICSASFCGATSQ